MVEHSVQKVFVYLLVYFLLLITTASLAFAQALDKSDDCHTIITPVTKQCKVAKIRANITFRRASTAVRRVERLETNYDRYVTRAETRVVNLRNRLSDAESKIDEKCTAELEGTRKCRQARNRVAALTRILEKFSAAYTRRRANTERKLERFENNAVNAENRSDDAHNHYIENCVIKNPTCGGSNTPTYPENPLG